MSISYKGFEISTAVEQLIDSGEWTTRVLLTKHHDDEIREKFCSASNTYKTKAEAERHSVEFGKQIIDGHYKNATVADL